MDSETPAAGAASVCIHCQTSLAGLPAVARFCPKCGKALAALPTAAAAFDPPPLPPELALSEPSATDGDDTALPSLVLLGFSNAMFRLGWRYEHGQGVYRNPHEAGRCYSKSARLGNPHAQSRLDEGGKQDDLAADERG